MTDHRLRCDSTSKWVRELRVQQELSKTELARHADMTQPATAWFEAGGAVPTLPVFRRLARSLGVELLVQLVQ